MTKQYKNDFERIYIEWDEALVKLQMANRWTFLKSWKLKMALFKTIASIGVGEVARFLKKTNITIEMHSLESAALFTSAIKAQIPFALKAYRETQTHFFQKKTTPVHVPRALCL